MTPAGYEAVSRSLTKLATMVPAATRYAPQLTRTRIACAVDSRLRVHALRCSASPAGDAPPLRRPEYALVDADTKTVLWTPVAVEVLDPAFPALALRNENWVGAIVGTLTRSEAKARLLSYEALVLSPPHEVESTYAQVVFERVGAAIRLALGPSGSAFILAQEWFPPPSQPRSVGLRLATLERRMTKTIVDPVPGTDAPGSYPSDSALYVTDDGAIHIVYDGVRRDTESGKPHFWHLTLDPAGKLLHSEDLGEAPRYPVLTRILPRGDGRLVVLSVYATAENRDRFAHTLHNLQGRDMRRGASEQYFVDYWLQAHAVWFDGRELQYTGPEGPRRVP